MGVCTCGVSSQAAGLAPAPALLSSTIKLGYLLAGKTNTGIKACSASGNYKDPDYTDHGRKRAGRKSCQKEKAPIILLRKRTLDALQFLTLPGSSLVQFQPYRYDQSFSTFAFREPSQQTIRDNECLSLVSVNEDPGKIFS